MLTERINWIDVAKCILIYLVFLGHIETADDPIYMIIFTFHMPAFFILSGYTFKEFVKMQPNIFFSGGGWFLITLFWASIFGYLWVKYVYKLNAYIQCSLLLLLAYLAFKIPYITHFFFQTYRLPFKLDSALMASFFGTVGYYINSDNLINKMLNNLFTSVLFVVLVYLFSFMLAIGSNIADCRYYHPPLYILAAFSGSLIIYLISIGIDKLRYASILRNIGRVTLPLFMLEGIFLHYSRTLLSIPIGESMQGICSFTFALCILCLEYPFAKLYYKIF